MKILRKVDRIYDRSEAVLAIVAGALLIFLGLATVYEVIMRYFLNSPTIWTVEISRFTLVYITFLGAAWVLKQEGHVKVDIVLNQLNPRTQSLLNVITSVISAIVCLIVTWYAVKVTVDSFQIGYRMDTVLRTPQYIVLAIIPVGTFFFFVRFLKRARGYLIEWRALADR